MNNFPIRSAVALLLFILAMILGLSWLWGLLFLLWLIPDLLSGVTYLMEPVDRKVHPGLYWAIMVVWLVSSAYLMVDGLAPKLLPEGWSTTTTAYHAQAGTAVGVQLSKAVEEEESTQPTEAQPNTMLQEQQAAKAAGVNTATVDASDAAKAPLPERHQHPEFHVVGLQALANPSKQDELASTLERLWADFFKTDYSKHINNITHENDVYVAYTNYSESEVTITLGFRTGSATGFKAGKGLSGVSITANEYVKAELKSTINGYDVEVWDQLGAQVSERGPGSADFEVYTFNSDYEVVKSWLWMAAK